MSLSQHITERLKITSNSKSATVTPKSKEQLQSIIEQELERQGPDADLNFIDTSEITDMSYLFVNYNTIRNIKIDQWDTSNVSNMKGVFFGCRKFNCDLSRWNVSNVKFTSDMFNGCRSFIGVGLDNWNTKNVTRMNNMFQDCKKFNCNIGNWNVSNVYDMSNMFSGCISFTGSGIENWNTSKVVQMNYMFSDCKNLKCDLSIWDVSNVKHKISAFDKCPYMPKEFLPKFR
nr:MAG TPA: protein of unknown function DUF285 [Caudoviricetes sp.]